MKAEYIDHMGTDLTVVNAARVSFDKTSDWERQHWDPVDGTEDKQLRVMYEKDEKLLRYLASHQHWTPFSHPQITLRETVPIFVARQRFKHMVGFTYNEVSRRYVSDEPEFFIPSVWRSAPTNGAKQGSSKDITGKISDYLFKEYKDVLDNCLSLYENMIEDGVAPEQARMVLPQSMYTSYYVTGSLYAFARAYNQRSDPHAQFEIRELAKQWNDIIQPLFPMSWAELTKVDTTESERKHWEILATSYKSDLDELKNTLSNYPTTNPL